MADQRAEGLDVNMPRPASDPPPQILTVGRLRAAMANLPDDARVGIEFGFELSTMTLPITFDLYAVGAYSVASDCVMEPVGTNPIEEGTVGVLCIDLAPEARR